MTKKHKKIEKKIRPKTGFEKLVEHKEKAKQKAKLKIHQSVFPTLDKPTSSKKIIDKENVRQLFARSRNRKSIFDIESDEDLVEHNPFVQDVGLFCEEQPEQNVKNDNKKKNKKEVFSEIILKSKQSRLEKTKGIEAMKECIDGLNDDFDRIKAKLKFSDRKAIKETRFEPEKTDYLKILDRLKDEELLRPSKLPKVDRPGKDSSEDEEDDDDGEEIGDDGLSEQDDNVEIGDMEEKEINYRDRLYERKRK